MRRCSHIRRTLLAGVALACALEAGATFFREGDFEWDCNYYRGQLTATLLRYTGAEPDVEIPSAVFYDGNRYVVEAIGDEFAQPFRDNQVVTSVRVPVTATIIGPEAFSGSVLREIDLGTGVRTIEGYAFYGCPELRSVTMHPHLSVIGERAFACCGSLRALTLGRGVSELAIGVFDETPLRELTVLNTVPPACTGALSDTPSFYNDCRLTVHLGLSGLFRDAHEWSKFSLIVEQAEPGDVNRDGTTDISDINIVINFLLGRQSGYDSTCCDIDQNGVVDIADINTLINIMLNL